MKITFWGVRGSIPTPITTEQIKEKLIGLVKGRYNQQIFNSENIIYLIQQLSPMDFGAIGGNTSCIEVNTGKDTIILDCGSGIKAFGNFISKNTRNYSNIFHIFLSHTHWDHISGLPFFDMAHDKNCEINFYSPLENLKNRLEYQHDHRFFPVGFELLKSHRNFHQLNNAPLKIKETEISYFPLNHPGKSYAYKIKNKDKILIYMTDLFIQQPNMEMINFCKNSNLLIFDSQFTEEEINHKKKYGHCTGERGVDLAIAAKISNLALFHHDPDKTDAEVQENFLKVKEYKLTKYPDSTLTIKLSYEGLKLDIL